MNRRLRAKANNQAARRKRDCPNQGKLIPAAKDQTHCDTCGDELGLPVAILVPIPDKEQLN